MDNREIGGENGQDYRENFLPGEQLAARLSKGSLFAMARRKILA